LSANELLPETDTSPKARPPVPYIQRPFDSKPARPRKVPNQPNLLVRSLAFAKLQSTDVQRFGVPANPLCAEPLWPDP
jgi:hypothetical protein